MYIHISVCVCVVHINLVLRTVRIVGHGDSELAHE